MVLRYDLKNIAFLFSIAHYKDNILFVQNLQIQNEWQISIGENIQSLNMDDHDKEYWEREKEEQKKIENERERVRESERERVKREWEGERDKENESERERE